MSDLLVTSCQPAMPLGKLEYRGIWGNRRQKWLASTRLGKGLGMAKAHCGTKRSALGEDGFSRMSVWPTGCGLAPVDLEQSNTSVDLSLTCYCFKPAGKYWSVFLTNLSRTEYAIALYVCSRQSPLIIHSLTDLIFSSRTMAYRIWFYFVPPILRSWEG